MKPISKVIAALFLGVLGCVPLWGQNLNFAPAKPAGPPKIQSSLWELAMPPAAEVAPVGDTQKSVVVICTTERKIR